MAKYATLSEQIYNELFDDITDQKLVCGQKLTLKMLKERFDTSHTPIREALTRLAENGLVTYYSNRGVTVTTFTDDDIKEIFQFVGELDALAIMFCKPTYSHEPLILELKTVIEKGDSLLKEDKIKDWKKYSEEFHDVFYRHANNSYLTDAAAKLRARVDVLSNMYYMPQNVEKINADHKAIFKLIKGDDFDGAAEKMRNHIQMDMAYALNAYKEYTEKNK